MTLGYRARSTRPRLGPSTPVGDPLLDNNAIINALAGRGPPELKALFANLQAAYVSGPTLAELRWLKGRLDPAHAGTAHVLKRLGEALARVDPAKVLTPSADQWARAGELAGEAARGVAGGARSIRTAFDRVELINDAATAIVALDLGLTVITQDADFELFLQITQGLSVLFYD